MWQLIVFTLFMFFLGFLHPAFWILIVLLWFGYLHMWKVKRDSSPEEYKAYFKRISLGK